MTSRGVNIGALAGPDPGESMSQFRDVDFRGGFGLTVTACLVSAVCRCSQVFG